MEVLKNRPLIAIDNVPGSQMLQNVALPHDAVLLFGAEGPGIRPELLSHASATVAIEQFGSTRSLNVGVAAGIVMYEWTRRNYIQQK
jgi:tRNA G18 (ribose-2'-O)-methylase SpoU